MRSPATNLFRRMRATRVCPPAGTGPPDQPLMGSRLTRPGALDSSTWRAQSEASTEVMSQIAGVQQIRSHFPALGRRHNGYLAAYFDGPGGTQVPRQVANAVD